MKKDSDWLKTYITLDMNKDIRKLRDNILKKLDTYYPLSTNERGHGNMWVADSIIHYILNYYKIKRT